jgi:hypothetical protein
MYNGPARFGLYSSSERDAIVDLTRISADLSSDFSYGLHDEEYLRLKILTCSMLDPI